MTTITELWGSFDTFDRIVWAIVVLVLVFGTYSMIRGIQLQIEGRRILRMAQKETDEKIRRLVVRDLRKERVR